MKAFTMFQTKAIRQILIALTLIVVGVPSAIVVAGSGATAAQAAVVNRIDVRGNRRVDADTIRSYVTVKPGRNYTTFDTDESLRALFATGLFSDVRISRAGSALLVEVEENPTINLVRFEGNEKVKDDQLGRIVQSQSLGIFSQDKVDSDLERVREVVRRSGRANSQVTVRVDQLDNNRVNVIFVINEGGRTKIKNIEFVGNNAFGDRRLADIISHNESNLLSWLKRDDIYDPDRLRADEERLRRFYFNRGYADFQVISAVAEFDSADNVYNIVITVEEGDLYRFGSIQIDNALAVVDDGLLQDNLKIDSGDIYSARNVEKTLVAMTDAIAASGYAFAEVTPRGDRNFENRTIDITFFVDEGPRTYVERIDVVGNTRTREYVIRREFDISEGDAYNRVLVNKAKTRLDALGFFDSVRMTTRPGSAPDRVVVVVNVKDKATGEFSIGGGYSSANGPIAEVSLTEKNFLGRGQFLKISAGLGDDVEKYELSFTEPYFLGNRIAAGFDISRTTSGDTDDKSFDSETTSFRLRAAAPLTDNLTASVNYTYTYEDLSIDPGTVVSTAVQDTLNRSPYSTSSIGYALTYSTIDNRKSPREGIYAQFRQDIAGLGGDAEYVRTEAELYAYYLLSEDADIVLFGGATAGAIEGFGSDDLRITDNFFKGGNLVRGFDSRGLGPRATDGEALGGKYFASVTAEVQFPLPLLPRSYGLRAALFADAGTVYGNDFDKIDPTIRDENSIRASVGASLLWDSPFGPLRADFAHVLAEEDFDEKQFFKFGVSTKF
ncbi:outer membrane protein assembly factor BamA [Ahrensia sp. R2A130]|uniref:outer membrane protein assembly factor BamA n=1 Tax=Ahrensia sp. R2A130 TaxID=744979 RepID=UPI0001E0C997|nr:outer membrane protein assembly factor BamA [Ahrensia sp. R2A130]EFL90240.1 outer membrane protein assembly complex, YaeT protein [Ahrensia sp. R2A130]